MFCYVLYITVTLYTELGTLSSSHLLPHILDIELMKIPLVFSPAHFVVRASGETFILFETLSVEG